jgi:hypothetical protein
VGVSEPYRQSERRWKLLSRRDIPDFNDPHTTYLTRWTLVETPWFAVHLHRIRRPDADRDLHDHPWSFVSVVLRGWYRETRLSAEGRRQCDYGYWQARAYTMRRRWSVAYRRAETMHAIHEISPTPLWTLVLCGPRRRRWGFRLTRTGHWLDADEYFASPAKAAR